VCAADGRRRGVTRRRTDDGAAAVRARGQGPRVGRRAQLPRRRGWLGRRSTEEVVGGRRSVVHTAQAVTRPTLVAADIGRGRQTARRVTSAVGRTRRVSGCGDRPGVCLLIHPAAAGGGRPGRRQAADGADVSGGPRVSLVGHTHSGCTRQRGRSSVVWSTQSRGDHVAIVQRARGEHVASMW
jgi:hypothetical protein